MFVKLVTLVLFESTLIIWFLKPSMLIVYEGRCGRAGRSGEAITLYTEDDVPFLRNIANGMKTSGSEFPSWALGLRKKKWKKHRPRRESISTTPKEKEEKGRRRRK